MSDNKEKNEKSGGSSQWHYVSPKNNCPHIHEIPIKFGKGMVKKKCDECKADENWICLTCGQTLCSRHKNSHASKHNKETGHPIAVSLSDLSFWCYECDSYIVHRSLKPVFEFLHFDKFGKGTKEVEEIYDDEKEVVRKAKIVADLIKKSSHCVIYTGAGISSGQIPDYRGPHGVWTLKDQKITAFCPIPLEEAKPTFSHLSLFDLWKRGMVQHVVSTNVDGLHMKSGIPINDLSELHGNIYKENCDKCKKLYYRDKDIASKDDDSKISMEDFEKFHKHFHGRFCEECGGHLVDTIVAFGENLPEKEIKQAYEHSYKCDLAIIIGTKLSVTPACNLPFKGKKYNKNHQAVYINLQRSNMDNQVDLKIYGKSDDVFKHIMKEMEGYERKS